MSMTLSYEKLFEPYTGDGHTLEAMIRYLTKQAAQGGLAEGVMEVALQEVFAELAAGKEYPKDHCPCGCGIDKAGTALIHEVQRRMFALDKDIQARLRSILQERHNTAILAHISEQNRQYLEANLPKPGGFLDFSRSPVLRKVKQWTGSRS